SLPLLPAFLKRLGCHRLEVARLRPSRQGARELLDPASFGEHPRGRGGHASGQVERPGTNGRESKTFEADLHPARRPSFGVAFGSETQEQLGKVDPDGAHFAACAAQAARVRKVAPVPLTPKSRREHGADRSWIHAAVRVAADLLVDGTRVEARAATN